MNNLNKISAKDLVVVIKPSICCGNTNDLGYHFIVNSISQGNTCCSTCGHRHNENLFTAWDTVNAKGEKTGYKLECLKRIPPLSELEVIEVEEVIVA